MYSGAITGPGPRYCPSIEAKLKMFPDKNRHQVFIEPEGWTAEEMYLLGASTSLPKEVQEEFLRTIPGFEKTRRSPGMVTPSSTIASLPRRSRPR